MSQRFYIRTRYYTFQRLTLSLTHLQMLFNLIVHIFETNRKPKFAGWWTYRILQSTKIVLFELSALMHDKRIRWMETRHKLFEVQRTHGFSVDIVLSSSASTSFSSRTLALTVAKLAIRGWLIVHFFLGMVWSTAIDIFKFILPIISIICHRKNQVFQAHNSNCTVYTVHTWKVPMIGSHSLTVRK